jgi:hypothetical protein
VTISSETRRSAPFPAFAAWSFLNPPYGAAAHCPEVRDVACTADAASYRLLMGESRAGAVPGPCLSDHLKKFKAQSVVTVGLGMRNQIKTLTVLAGCGLHLLVSVEIEIAELELQNLDTVR